MSVTLHTDLGDLKIEVFCESVPKTAENFLALCASSYYNSSLFHRNIPSFIVQTGAPAKPNPDPKRNPGVSIWGTQFEDEIKPALRHNGRGIVSMANKGPDTNNSQFFICYAPAPHLDGKNTVFGKVIEGADTTLDSLEHLENDAKGRPKDKVTIKSVTIHANPLAG